MNFRISVTEVIHTRSLLKSREGDDYGTYFGDSEEFNISGSK